MFIEILNNSNKPDEPDKPPEYASTSLVGVRVDRVTQQQALSQIAYLLTQYQLSQRQAPCQQVVTVNPEFVVAAQKNPSFRRAINEAALVVADGMGIVWGTRFLRTPVPERITGTDLLPQLARLCAFRNYRLYLLGAAPGIAKLAAERLQELAPGIQIVGCYAGSPSPSEEDTIMARLTDAAPDLLCVAYGAPAQELWIKRNLERLPAGVAIGVGGAYDFLSGRQQRAPQLMRRLGLEWLYRLYREPSRWRRMLALPQAAFLVLVKGHGNR
jgi:N-acetylglucosaminyldiphosphoundecaprenol N-acetyl-beta-D-mannosaminyltransferase